MDIIGNKEGIEFHKDLVMFPEGMTKQLQMLDVIVNKAFKDHF